ncbi:NAD(+) diphosphatase [Gryllotalpicola protaetiae]|uniref:NAD(+) diphosphatase n=1 Tax=Gryllotalpicola protaetiae TaxID=2419771 RepID=A0A387BEW6_9MICO|nr:NAD(+) diphosphatase [Gryllotalpicola protaetiae]AYG02525.1 NAD(+) diphosphatase [Gryllotalpicola protaetiae]
MTRRTALEPLTGLVVDRDAERRARPELFDELLADPATRLLPLWRGKALTTTAEGERALDLITPDRQTAALLRVYLGRTVASGIPVIAVTLTDAAAVELEPDQSRWVGLREAGADLGEVDYALFVEAVAIANWHESHTHCPRCGTPTVVEQGGWVRRCFVDGKEVFPRTDPAIIVRVLDDADRILLGSNAMWENNRWSILAGFVEPGEPFEAAVIREVHEEAGVVCTRPRYLGSQPWPFPASVMIGFEARAVAQGEVPTRPDGQEILAVRWFTRDELWAERDDLKLPMSASIAHAIIAEWYGGPLSEAPRQGRIAP